MTATEASPSAGGGLAARARWGLDRPALAISLGGASSAAGWARAFDWAERAERLGLHSVWLPEMHFAPGSTASPLVALAALAQRTERIRLATTSLLLPIHHPLRIAREVAALDHLSGGRVIVGLGRGFRAPLFAAFGLDPATKRDRFDRALDRILALWAGETVDFAGTPFDAVPEARRRPPARPHQTPHPPLAVAAFGRKGLAQAARRGLPYLASPVEPFDLIRDNLAFHRDALPAGADPADAVVPILRTVFVSENARETTRVLAALDAERRIPRGAKLPEALARAVAAPIEDRVIVGGAEAVTERLAAYRDALGLNLLIVRPELAGVDVAAQRRSLECLAERVMPALG